ncbi:MAG: hypothetical protein GKR90_17740 [Pseudomonadales bacterium]|nr:hypothetical protein [Pseudomonadales bacterium]
MNSQSINNWIQVVTTLSVAIGVGLVLFELRQAEQIARTEIVSNLQRLFVETPRAVGGEHYAESIAKACIDPSQLVPADYVVLNSYFEMIQAHTNLYRSTEAHGEYGIPWEAYARGNYSKIASSRHGRWWLIHNIQSRDQLSPTHRRLIAAALKKGEQEDCSEYYREFMLLDGARDGLSDDA